MSLNTWILSPLCQLEFWILSNFQRYWPVQVEIEYSLSNLKVVGLEVKLITLQLISLLQSFKCAWMKSWIRSILNFIGNPLTPETDVFYTLEPEESLGGYMKALIVPKDLKAWKKRSKGIIISLKSRKRGEISNFRIIILIDFKLKPLAFSLQEAFRETTPLFSSWKLFSFHSDHDNRLFLLTSLIIINI